MSNQHQFKTRYSCLPIGGKPVQSGLKKQYSNICFKTLQTWSIQDQVHQRKDMLYPKIRHEIQHEQQQETWHALNLHTVYL